MSELFLMPGLVGLAIVDAFAARLPVVTTSIPIHSPEIEYLQPGENGSLCDFNEDAYARAVAALLGDERGLERMQQAAAATAEQLTLDNMVGAFADGILRCLEAGKR
jgi:glycosyltransferase involved in cell wall biosynthesis